MFTDMSLSGDLNKSFIERLAETDRKLEISATFLILQVFLSGVAYTQIYKSTAGLCNWPINSVATEYRICDCRFISQSRSL